MLAEKILGRVEDLSAEKFEGLDIDCVVLDHYDLAKPHQKARSGAGETVMISLPYGERLFYGAVLYKDDKKIIVVDLAEEEVLEIRPSGTLEWAGAAYNVGNMHSSAYFTENSILIPYDASLERMVKKSGVPYEKTRKKLTGIRAGSLSGEHEHGHDHAPGHQHEHGHDHALGHQHEHEHDNDHEHRRDRQGKE